MKKNNRVGLIVSICILIGFPLIFTIVSIVTNNWFYLIMSIVPSITAGLTGLMVALAKGKKEKEVA